MGMNVYAMEIAPLCFFYKMPIEILNHIAIFLTFDDIETENEFIERTKALTTQNDIPNKYLTLLPIPNPKQQKKLQAVRCPNNKIIALLQSFPEQEANTTLTVIDKKNNKILYTQFIGLNFCFNIAISHNGTMIATALLNALVNKNAQNNQFETFEEIVVIKNIISKKEEAFDIPYTFSSRLERPALAFNKQGTHIILHGTDSTQLKNNSSDHHMIIPLTINPSIDNDNKKTLEKYFAQKMICKNLLQQITQ